MLWRTWRRRYWYVRERVIHRYGIGRYVSIHRRNTDMHTYTCETPGLQCACCGDIIAIGEEFAVVTTPSEPGQNTCVECAKQKLGSVKHARAEHTLNRKQKAEKERQDREAKGKP